MPYARGMGMMIQQVPKHVGQVGLSHPPPRPHLIPYPCRRCMRGRLWMGVRGVKALKRKGQEKSPLGRMGWSRAMNQKLHHFPPLLKIKKTTISPVNCPVFPSPLSCFSPLPSQPPSSRLSPIHNTASRTCTHWPCISPWEMDDLGPPRDRSAPPFRMVAGGKVRLMIRGREAVDYNVSMVPSGLNLYLQSHPPSILKFKAFNSLGDCWDSIHNACLNAGFSTSCRDQRVMSILREILPWMCS